jgi:hypothetical protein
MASNSPLPIGGGQTSSKERSSAYLAVAHVGTVQDIPRARKEMRVPFQAKDARSVARAHVFHEKSIGYR